MQVCSHLYYPTKNGISAPSSLAVFGVVFLGSQMLVKVLLCHKTVQIVTDFWRTVNVICNALLYRYLSFTCKGSKFKRNYFPLFVDSIVFGVDFIALVIIIVSLLSRLNRVMGSNAVAMDLTLTRLVWRSIQLAFFRRGGYVTMDFEQTCVT